MTKLKIPDGHDVFSFTGKKLIPQPPITTAGRWGRKKTIPQPPLEETVTDITILSDLESYANYSVVFSGEFELLGVYLYTSSSEYGSNRTWPVAYCQLLDRAGEEWAACLLTFRIDSTVSSPRMVRYEHHEGAGSSAPMLWKNEASLIFPSKEVLKEMVKTLEPGDSLAIVKLRE